MDLKSAVVVVTGASAGIGRETARAFAKRGATVAVNARRERVLDEVVEECRSLGADAMAHAADVADAAAMEELARAVIGNYGRIDVWVNNAGVSLFGRLEDVPINAWYRVIETNLFGTYHGIRATLPWMREQGSGVIINVSSMLGKLGSPYMSSYVTSKHAVRALSDCLRQELLDAPGVQVCTVLPGPIDTPLFQEGGNYSGRQIKPVKPVIPAARAARTIVACAERPRREAIVGASTAWALGFNRLVPGLTERVAARRVGRDHFSESPAPHTNGKIFEPLNGVAEVSGGWTRTSDQAPVGVSQAASDGDGGSSRAKWGVLGALAAGGAAAGVAGIVRSRRS